MARPVELTAPGRVASRGERWSRAWSYVFGLGLLAAVIAPGFRDARDDSFPFSTYPMFARPHTKPVIYFAEGFDRRRRRVRLPPHLIGNQEVMQATKLVRRAVLDGADGVERLCQRIASRVADDPQFAHVVRVQLVSARFDAIGYFTHSTAPEERTEHGGCNVARDD